ncbi:MAG: hypothetical protein OXG30_04640 [bacterium]|nr:hypothetical protein [bacterium]MCY3888320.1 hypothetical protein [bacterium]MCY4134187.1 hypothetical protein [bacterium]
MTTKGSDSTTTPSEKGVNSEQLTEEEMEAVAGGIDFDPPSDAGSASARGNNPPYSSPRNYYDGSAHNNASGPPPALQ